MSSRVTVVGLRLNYDKKKFWDHSASVEFTKRINTINMYIWWLTHSYFAFIKFFMVFFTIYVLNLSLFFECFLLRAQWHSRYKNKFWNLRSTERWVKKKQKKTVSVVRWSEKKRNLRKRINNKKIAMLNKIVKKVKKKFNKKKFFYIYTNKGALNKAPAIMQPETITRKRNNKLLDFFPTFKNFKRKSVRSRGIFKLLVLTPLVKKKNSIKNIMRRFRSASINPQKRFIAWMLNRQHFDMQTHNSNDGVEKNSVARFLLNFKVISKYFLWSLLLPELVQNANTEIHELKTKQGAVKVMNESLTSSIEDQKQPSDDIATTPTNSNDLICKKNELSKRYEDEVQFLDKLHDSFLLSEKLSTDSKQDFSNSYLLLRDVNKLYRFDKGFNSIIDSTKFFFSESYWFLVNFFFKKNTEIEKIDCRSKKNEEVLLYIKECVDLYAQANNLNTKLDVDTLLKECIIRSTNQGSAGKRGLISRVNKPRKLTKAEYAYDKVFHQLDPNEFKSRWLSRRLKKSKSEVGKNLIYSSQYTAPIKSNSKTKKYDPNDLESLQNKFRNDNERAAAYHYNSLYSGRNYKASSVKNTKTNFVKDLSIVNMSELRRSDKNKLYIRLRENLFLTQEKNLKKITPNERRMGKIAIKKRFIRINRLLNKMVFRKLGRTLKRDVTIFYKRKYQAVSGGGGDALPNDQSFFLFYKKKKISKRLKKDFLRRNKELLLRSTNGQSYYRGVFLEKLIEFTNSLRKYNKITMRLNPAVNNKRSGFSQRNAQFFKYYKKKNVESWKKGSYFKLPKQRDSFLKKKNKFDRIRFRRFTSEFREFYFENELEYNIIFKKMKLRHLFPARSLIGHANYFLKKSKKLLQNDDLIIFKQHFLKDYKPKEETAVFKKKQSKDPEQMDTNYLLKKNIDSLKFSYEEAPYQAGYSNGIKFMQFDPKKIRLLFFNNQSESWNLFKKASFKAIFTRLNNNKEKYDLRLAKDWDFYRFHDIKNWNDVSRLYYIKSTNLIYQRFNDTYSLRHEFLERVKLKARVRYPESLYSKGRFLRRYKAINQLPDLAVAYHCKAGGITVTSIHLTEEYSTFYSIHPAEYFPTLDTGVLEKGELNKYDAINFEDGVQEFKLLPKFYLNGSRIQLDQKNAFYYHKVDLKKRKLSELYLRSQIAANKALHRFHKKSSSVHKFKDGALSSERIALKKLLLKSGILKKRLKKNLTKLQNKKKAIQLEENNSSIFMKRGKNYFESGNITLKRRSFFLMMRRRINKRLRKKGKKKIFRLKRLNKVFLKYYTNFKGFYKNQSGPSTTTQPSEFLLPMNAKSHRAWFYQIFNFGKIGFSEFYREIINKNAVSFLFNKDALLNNDKSFLKSSKFLLTSDINDGADSASFEETYFWARIHPTYLLNHFYDEDFFLDSRNNPTINSYKLLRNSLNYNFIIKKLKSNFKENSEELLCNVGGFSRKKKTGVKIAQLSLYRGGFIPMKSDIFKKKPLKKILKKISKWSKKEYPDKEWSETYFLGSKSCGNSWRIKTYKSIDAENHLEAKIWLQENLKRGHYLTGNHSGIKADAEEKNNFFEALKLKKKPYKRRQLPYLLLVNDGRIDNNFRKLSKNNNNKRRADHSTVKKKLKFNLIKKSLLTFDQKTSSRFFLNSNKKFLKFTLEKPNLSLKKSFNLISRFRFYNTVDFSKEKLKLNIFNYINKKKFELWYRTYIQKRNIEVFSNLSSNQNLLRINNRLFDEQSRSYKIFSKNMSVLQRGSVMNRSTFVLPINYSFNFSTSRQIRQKKKSELVSKILAQRSQIIRNKALNVEKAQFTIKKKIKFFLGAAFSRFLFWRAKSKKDELYNYTNNTVERWCKYNPGIMTTRSSKIDYVWKNRNGSILLYEDANRMKHLHKKLFINNNNVDGTNCTPLINDVLQEFMLDFTPEDEINWEKFPVFSGVRHYFEEIFLHSFRTAGSLFNMKILLNKIKNFFFLTKEKSINIAKKEPTYYFKTKKVFSLFSFTSDFIAQKSLKLFTTFNVPYRKKKAFMVEKFFTFYSSGKFSLIFKKFSYIVVHNIVGIILLVRSLATFKFLERWIIKYIFFPAKNIGLVRMLVLLFFSCSLLGYYQSFLTFLAFILEKWRERKHFKLLSVVKTLVWNFPIVNKFLGFRLLISGKFNMKPRARSVQILKNFLPALQSISFQVNYYYTMACNFFGAFGMHLWVYRRGGVYNV